MVSSDVHPNFSFPCYCCFITFLLCEILYWNAHLSLFITLIVLLNCFYTKLTDYPSSTDISSTTLRLQTLHLTTFRLQVYLYPLQLINRGLFLIVSLKRAIIFSGIQLLITDKIIFINPASIEWKLLFIHASRLISSFYLLEKLFQSIQLLFQHRDVLINPTSI